MNRRRFLLGSSALVAAAAVVPPLVAMDLGRDEPPGFVVTRTTWDGILIYEDRPPGPALTWERIAALKREAERRRIRPVVVDGKEFYVLWC